MALTGGSQSKKTGEEKLDKSRSFRGYPQPPVNERLEEIKNFLADEDPNRRLPDLWYPNLAEIGDYVKYIEDENLEHDADLFRDVKVMLEVHHDWERRQREPPAEGDCCKPQPTILANRLIPIELKQEIERERDLMGIENQTREDHCPFTVEREEDQWEFLQALKKDASIDPAKVDERTSLFWVESRAYSWARSEPALIPYWMHPTEGLQRNGFRRDDKKPWYCGIAEELAGNLRQLKTLSPISSERDSQIRRLLRAQWLGHDLMTREEAINQILKTANEKGIKFTTAPDVDGATYGEIGELEAELFFVLQDFLPTDLYQLKLEIHTAIIKGIPMSDQRAASRSFKAQYCAWVENLLEHGEVEVERYRPGPTHAIDERTIYYRKPALKFQWKIGPNLFMTEYITSTLINEQASSVLLLDQMPQELSKLYEELLKKRAELGGGPSHLEEQFIQKYLNWYHSLTEAEIERSMTASKRLSIGGAALEGLSSKTRSPLDFVPRAERRGVQRAAIELSLHLLATSQEQHRPNDRFRIVELLPPQRATEEEVPISLPLEATKRPVELDTFEFTKKMLDYREWEDSDYDIARNRGKTEHPQQLIDPPANYNGPFTVANTDEVQEAIRRREYHLTQIYSRLVSAERSAPRPLIQSMLLRVQDGMDAQSNKSHPLFDTEELSNEDIELLIEITEPSWDKSSKLYSDVPSILSRQELKELEEFEDNVNEIIAEIPFWSPASTPVTNDQEYLRQRIYNRRERSRRGIEFNDLKQRVNTKRLNAGSTEIHLWTDEEALKYLDAMRQASRIHLDTTMANPDQPLISRIPFIGHPENKYVLSRDEAERSPGVCRGPDGHLEVQYNADGEVGPPIVQPNKFYHFQKLAFRLGRDISNLLRELASKGRSDREYLICQYSGILTTVENMNTVTEEDCDQEDAPIIESTKTSLQELAVQLDKVAPELAEEAGITVDSNMTDAEAAALVQMQIIEEANNNWESRFPENEHVWEFAAPRIESAQEEFRNHPLVGAPRLKRFFNMRRFPPCCQSTETKTAIEASGPEIQEKPKPKTPKPTQTQSGIDAEMQLDRPIELHRGMNQAPFFPFGETPYQEAFLNFRMQNDLKDVPEFQPRPQPRRFFSRKPQQSQEDPVAPTGLPELPPGWKPTSITREEQRSRDIEIAKTLAGFPDPNVLENYHTQAEIEKIKRRQAYELDVQAAEQQKQEIETFVGKLFNRLTVQEQGDAQRALGIDPYGPRPSARTATGADTRDAPRSRGRGVGRASRGATNITTRGRGSPQGSSRNRRSKSPLKKRGAGTRSGRQSPPKRVRVETDSDEIEM
ncbi:hypothetical protein G7Y89_g10551 [Cudoniella acicularis]|uniref:Uncharacterized protein n=1 Tax=Cudoniella acicularis TaxID=354080 RepID=A0A8H4RFB4_9HELO|nr:hypothetical protein G7Y89_g10551 [Cudoniella acicularis]